MPGRWLPVCQAGRAEIVLSPQLLQRRRLPTSGTVRVSGSRSTLTSAERPQLAHAAMTKRTPFWRIASWARNVALEFILDFCDRYAFDPGSLDDPKRDSLGGALNDPFKMLLVVLRRLV